MNQKEIIISELDTFFINFKEAFLKDFNKTCLKSDLRYYYFNWDYRNHIIDNGKYSNEFNGSFFNDSFNFIYDKQGNAIFQIIRTGDNI